MPRFLPRLLLFLLLCPGLPHPALAAAPSDEEQAQQTRKQLESTRKDIEDLQQLLRQLEQEKARVQKQLKGTESDMGTLEQQIRELKQQIDGDSTALQQLGQQQNALQKSQGAQQQRLMQHSRVIWQEGEGAPLRLLLSGQPPDQINRSLTYYSYLSQARQREILQLRETIGELADIRAQIATRKAQLDLQSQELQTRRAQLQTLRTQRSQLLATLNKQQQSRAAKLKLSQRQQAELSLVLQALETALAQQAEAEAKARAALQQAQHAQPQGSGQVAAVGFANTQNRPFAQTRGQLPWPLSGKLLASYGSPRGVDARVRWDGVLIGAAEGSAVRAIHPGQVVLAEYLSGMGLMLIINHGGNYLSLYGHNQSLLKQVGDLVKAGEPIATVGSSGGQAFPALYFAIRHQKTPSDPAQWCMAQK